MPVHIINKQSAVKVSARRLKRLLEEVLACELGREAQVNVLLTDDEKITELNGKFLGKHRPTDVMAWVLDEEDEGDDEPLFGEVAVSGETALRQGRRHGNTPEEELTLYAVHGILHLAGYDDLTKAKRSKMWKRQREIMKAYRMGSK